MVVMERTAGRRRPTSRQEERDWRRAKDGPANGVAKIAASVPGYIDGSRKASRRTGRMGNTSGSRRRFFSLQKTRKNCSAPSNPTIRLFSALRSAFSSYTAVSHGRQNHAAFRRLCPMVRGRRSRREAGRVLACSWLDDYSAERLRVVGEHARRPRRHVQGHGPPECVLPAVHPT